VNGTIAFCPFCGESKNFGFEVDQGDKWGRVVCKSCAAEGPEVRTSYDMSDNAPWRNSAIAAWNRRELMVSPDKEIVDAKYVKFALDRDVKYMQELRDKLVDNPDGARYMSIAITDTEKALAIWQKHITG